MILLCPRNRHLEAVLANWMSSATTVNQQTVVIPVLSCCETPQNGSRSSFLSGPQSQKEKYWVFWIRQGADIAYRHQTILQVRESPWKSKKATRAMLRRRTKTQGG